MEQLAAVARTEVAALSAWAKAERAEISARVTDALSDRELASTAAHVPLNPASNQKLLTMAVALERLGPDFRFSTSLHGRAAGDTLSELVLRSNGDPTLSLDDLLHLARELAAQGYRRVSGDLLVDQSAFDRLWDPPAYEKHMDEWATYRAPVSAVAVEGNTVSLHVAANAQGSPARVWVTPEGLATVSGSVATGPAGRAHDVRLSVRAQSGGFTLLVGGTMPSSQAPLAFGRRIADPELAPGRALLGLLREQQISISGSVRSGGSEIQAERVSVRSRSLAEVLHALGKHSDNFVAEMLLKSVGANASGTAGSSAAGATVIEEYLSRHAALDLGTRLKNGSGLYDANRVSAFTLTRVLGEVANDPRVYPEFLASLSIGGLDGTLSQRFRSLRNARTVRAKTGTLASVTALSGYVLRAAPNGPLAFSVLLNGVGDKLAEGRQRIDRAIEAIARVA
ncbi:MAG TPA: D-alanyl-D-alanine carboxypeptidase/D-alanyl-D-alanine-endopeptidase [Polyangiaceae bacterium]|nr:D-alanyl-D-alanine carboxypeptidase/D-alanyl-D-alanine-endopeptidase [Polyangiaceae bacterium]